jgi:MoxR-like ATPase
VALLLASQAAAAIDDRAFVTPDDVKGVASLVLPHRLIVQPQAEIDGVRAAGVLEEILQTIPVPRDATA